LNRPISPTPRAGFSGVRIPSGVREFPILHNVRPALPPPSMIIAALSRELSGRGMMLTTHSHVMSRLKMRGAAGLPLLPLYVFRAWTGKPSRMSLCTRTIYWLRLRHLSAPNTAVQNLHFLYDWCFHPILEISLFNIRPRHQMSRRMFLVIVASSSERIAAEHIK
jgi:hypothetical protein